MSVLCNQVNIIKKIIYIYIYIYMDVVIGVVFFLPHPQEDVLAVKNNQKDNLANNLVCAL